MRRLRAAWIFPGICYSTRSLPGCCSVAFYAAVTAGVSISFGMLDIVNIAHPGLRHSRLVSRLFHQYQFRRRSDHRQHTDAAVLLRARRLGLSGLLPVVRKTRPGIAARPCVLLRPAVRHRGVADPGVRRRLPLRRSRLYRAQHPYRNCRPAAAHAGAVPGGAGAVQRASSCSSPAPSPAAPSWRCRRINWRCN